jgi:hypothetical protein
MLRARLAGKSPLASYHWSMSQCGVVPSALLKRSAVPAQIDKNLLTIAEPKRLREYETR